MNPRQEKKDGHVSLGAHTFDQNVSREQLAKMIILHEYPLNLVQHVGFRNLLTQLTRYLNMCHELPLPVT